MKAYNSFMLRNRIIFTTIFATVAAVTLSAAAQSIATNSPVPLSTRIVAYEIDAHLDTDTKSLDATEKITYKNLTGQPLSYIPFHLYLNAFRPQSSFTSETHFTGGIRDSEKDDDYPKEKLGGIDISKIDADGYGDLTKQMHFTAPDDGNMLDHTVMQVELTRPLAPGASITFHLAFHDQFPISIARNGYKRDFIMGGQWYPKPGVFWHGAWNCHQYHSTTEFFSDFAQFNVHLTLPQRYVVGASGVPTGSRTNSDGSKTLDFYGEDIGDFAFATSPHFTVTDGTYASSMGPVQVHVLALACHPKAGPRYREITEKTLAEFDKRYGPYPYKIITVIDPEPGSQIGGMEYPTLFTGGTSWYEPTYGTELVTEHEFGHQYWYGMVATNEFEDAWLDEGINSYTEVKVLDAILGRNTSVLNRDYANAGDYEVQRLSYVASDDYDPVTRWAFKFRNSGSYGGVTYGKTATLLATLGPRGPGKIVRQMAGADGGNRCRGCVRVVGGRDIDHQRGVDPVAVLARGGSTRPCPRRRERPARRDLLRGRSRAAGRSPRGRNCPRFGNLLQVVFRPGTGRRLPEARPGYRRGQGEHADRVSDWGVGEQVPLLQGLEREALFPKSLCLALSALAMSLCCLPRKTEEIAKRAHDQAPYLGRRVSRLPSAGNQTNRKE